MLARDYSCTWRSKMALALCRNRIAGIRQFQCRLDCSIVCQNLSIFATRASLTTK